MKNRGAGTRRSEEQRGLGLGGVKNAILVLQSDSREREGERECQLSKNSDKLTKTYGIESFR